jgi:hypothetical protein
MGFFSFQLSRLNACNIRSRTTDIDLLTFGVLVNGHDQGHGYATIPVWPGNVYDASQFTEAAAINGHPYGRTHMSKNWVIGPLYVEDTDKVEIVYTATNLSDSNLPSMSQQKSDEWMIKILDMYYSALVGEFVSSLGLSVFAEWLGKAGGALASIVTDPVGKLLGYEPQGPCNGTVFADKKTFSGASLAILPSTPGTESWGTHQLSVWNTEQTDHYSDAATHDSKACGELAQTDVSMTIKRYEKWSLKFFAAADESLGLGVRRLHPNARSIRAAYGLRVP